MDKESNNQKKIKQQSKTTIKNNNQKQQSKTTIKNNNQKQYIIYFNII